MLIVMGAIETGVHLWGALRQEGNVEFGVRGKITAHGVDDCIQLHVKTRPGEAPYIASANLKWNPMKTACVRCSATAEHSPEGQTPSQQLLFAS